jgi:hypothetical protein
MNSKMQRNSLPIAVLAPVLLAASWALDKPSYAPKAGNTVTKSYTVEGELELEDMSLEVNGQDVSAMAGQMEMAMKTQMKLIVTDTYEAMGSDRPAKLKRAFDEISSNTHVSQSNPMMGDQESDIPLTSELEGRTVVFTWDDAAADFETAFATDEGDPELLTGLAEDLDLRGFLPPGDVAEGDTWQVPTEAVKHALAPGGDLRLRPETMGEMMGMDQFSQNDLVGELEGDFEATYAGTREEDGVQVAVIKLKIDATSAQDLTERMSGIREQMKEQVPEGVDVDVDISAFDSEYEYEAEGELLWNVEAGMAHALHLSGEVRVIMDISMSMTMAGQGEQAMEISQTLAGTSTIALTTGE